MWKLDEVDLFTRHAVAVRFHNHKHTYIQASLQHLLFLLHAALVIAARGCVTKESLVRVR